MAYYRDMRDGSEDDSFIEIFEEFDFAPARGECTFFCPECRKMKFCILYQNSKEDWEWLYV